MKERWKVFLGTKLVEVQDENGLPVVSWSGFDDSRRTFETHCANAKLIASAPDLRIENERLKKAVEEAEKIFTNSEYLEISGYCRVKIFDVNDWVFAYGKEKRNDGISEV